MVSLPVLRLFAAMLLVPCVVARDVTVQENETEILITLAVELCPDEDVTQQDLRDFAATHEAQVEAMLNRNDRAFRTGPGAARKRIRIDITFAFLETCDAPFARERHRFKIRPGRPRNPRRSNATAGELFLENTSRTVAHEMAHALGLDDEYDYQGGGSNPGLMGRSGTTDQRRVTDSHLMTILFVNVGNPDEAEALCRRTLKSLLRDYPRAQAREIFKQTCPEEMFDRLVALLDLNGVTLQPRPPQPPKKR